MSKNDPIIIWQKWVDPFFGDSEEIEDDKWSNSIYENDESEISSYDDKEESKLDNTSGNILNKQPVKVIATPMGIIPMNEHTASGKIFNFWIGHTNFDITQKIVSIIESTDGVESLDIFTRYRFRIAVGKAFDDSCTMRQINNRVYEYINI